MGKIFDIDSPLMRVLTRLADVMWLNILTLIFAIPLALEQFFFLGPLLFGEAEFEISFVLWAWIFGIIASIPLGPALTGMHFTLLKMVRDEDSYVTKTFFKSFRENFKQGAVLQIIQFTAGGILVIDYLILRTLGGGVYRYAIMAIAIFLFMVSLYIFPLLSKFVNTVFGTIKNAFLMSIMALPKTALMAVVTLLPLLILYFFDIKSVPVLILLGVAGPGYFCAKLYDKTFKKFEPEETAVSEEEEMNDAIRKIDGEEESQETP